MRRYLQQVMLSAVGGTAIAMASLVGLAGCALAADSPDLKPPTVPAAIQVPAGNTAYILGHATARRAIFACPPPAGTPGRRPDR